MVEPEEAAASDHFLVKAVVVSVVDLVAEKVLDLVEAYLVVAAVVSVVDLVAINLVEQIVADLAVASPAVHVMEQFVVN